jgi:hypothetical protein
MVRGLARDRFAHAAKGGFAVGVVFDLARAGRWVARDRSANARATRSVARNRFPNARVTRSVTREQKTIGLVAGLVTRDGPRNLPHGPTGRARRAEQ